MHPNLAVASRDRSESIQAHIAREMPSGDDAFPPSFLNERLAFVDVACDAMDRIGDVWPVGKKVRLCFAPGVPRE